MFFQLIIYLFLCLSVSYAWSDTDISRPLRNLIARIPYIRKPLLCHECSSFWVSLMISLFINPLDGLTYEYLSNIFSSFIGFFINLIFVRNNLIKYKEF
jgi:hypothetical protein